MSGYGTLPEIKRRLINLINTLLNYTPNRYYQCHGTSNEIQCARAEIIQDHTNNLRKYTFLKVPEPSRERVVTTEHVKRTLSGDSKSNIINTYPNKSNIKLVINKTSNRYDHDNKCKIIIDNIIDNNPDISIKNICKIKKIVNKKYRHTFKHILNDKGYLTKKLLKQYVIYLNDI